MNGRKAGRPHSVPGGRPHARGPVQLSDREAELAAVLRRAWGIDRWADIVRRALEECASRLPNEDGKKKD